MYTVLLPSCSLTASFFIFLHIYRISNGRRLNKPKREEKKKKIKIKINVERYSKNSKFCFFFLKERVPISR